MSSNYLRGENGIELANKTISEIARYNLSASPQNYEIFLNYLADWIPDLTTDITKMIKIGDSLTDNQLREIYDRYFSPEQAIRDVEETGTKMIKELGGALSAIRQSNINNKHYEAKLETATHSLEESTLPTVEDIREIVNALTDATRTINEENVKLSESLENSSMEINQLKSSLQKVRAEALTDGLTGIANRKLFDETLEFRMNEAAGNHTTLALMFCDIDHFKSFNDNWGHQTGDQVIRFVAQTLSRLSYPDHLVSRYGGEEFAIIMPRVSLQKSASIAERMRRAIEAKRLLKKATGESLGTITVSFGIAVYRPDDSSQVLIERADACLYRSKHAGRNCITLEDALDVSVN